jgi:hypothetical protein
VAADLNPERLSRQSFEWRAVARCGPELELRVAGRAQLQQVVVPPIVELETTDRLRVAAIEAFRQPQNGGERSHRAPGAPPEIGKTFVFPFRRALPVIAGDEGDRFDFVRLEAAEIAVLHEIVRVLVVPLVADEDTDVVEDRRVLQPLALAIRETVDRARLIEEADRETRDVLRMLRPVVAAFRQLEDAAAADVGVAIGLGDFLAVPRDVVQHQPLAQRQVAKRDFVGA